MIRKKRYEANYAGFNVSGKYTLFFYVQEKTGLISSFKKAFLYKKTGFLRRAISTETSAQT